MKIRYINTRKDLLIARLAGTCSNKLVVGLWGLLGVFVSYSMLSQETFRGESIGIKLFIIGFCFGLVFAFNALLLAVFLLVQTLTQSGKGLLGEHVLRITDEGLEESTIHNTTLSRWTAFHGCKRRAGIWFIYVTEEMAHFVPATRPMLEGDRDVFIAEIKNRIVKSRTDNRSVD